MKNWTSTRLVLVLAALAAGICALWGFWIEPRSLGVKEHRIEIEGWPEACAGLRVAVIADLQEGSPQIDPDAVQQVVGLTRDAHADLVLLAGDYLVEGHIGGHPVDPEDTARRLAQISAPMGTFSVLGNHDWWLDGYRVSKALLDQGIPVLHNRAQLTGNGSCLLWVAGVADRAVGLDDVPGTLDQVPENQAVIVLTHSPDIFPEVPPRVALTVAGHTHGGQVALPFLGPPFVPSVYGRRFANGHVVEDGRHLFVSPGIGTTLLPVRFLVPPEISLLEIWPEDAIPPADPGPTWQ